MKKVSIITPCYNAARYLEITYQSVRSQSLQDWEWVLVDDCSTDNSWEILQKIAAQDERVKIFKNEQNSGAAVTRNRCLDEANGEYVAFLDSDDLWYPEKLQKQVEFMQRHDVNFSYHNYETVDAQGNHLKPQLVAPYVTQKQLLKFNPFATSSIMIERSVIENDQIRFLAHLRRRQDYLFWYQALGASKKSAGIDQILSSYRIFADDSLSADKKKMAKFQWTLYRTEFGLNIFQSIYYFIHYAWHGVQKYFF